jgi:pimeloyl-ACP methyl ester carboxylesterase
MDLHELVLHVQSQNGGKVTPLKGLGGSLGCSILWCYAELFTTAPFTHMIFVDQSPLQNSTLDGWDSRYCNRGMNSAPAVAALQTTLAFSPETAHRGTIAACLAYRSHPLDADNVAKETSQSDEAFFLGEAMKGNPKWYGQLMADHTALDWRDSIAATFGPGSGSQTKVLVVASSRSGCFPSEGPMKVVEFVNGGEKEGKGSGVVVEWGGHWCYWEKPDLFNQMVLGFLDGK